MKFRIIKEKVEDSDKYKLQYKVGLFYDWHIYTRNLVTVYFNTIKEAKEKASVVYDRYYPTVVEEFKLPAKTYRCEYYENTSNDGA